jgi:hypothetical protein
VTYFGAINRQAKFPRVRCNSPHISTVIEVDGTLRPCYFLPSYGKLAPHDRAQQNSDSVGTRLAVSDSLPEAINLPTAQALRHAYRTGQRPECARCVCPLYKGPRSLLKM